MSNLLEGKTALILGVANRWSLAYTIAEAFRGQGARLVLTYQGERQRETVEALGTEIGAAQVLPCDVTQDQDLDALAQRLGARKQLALGAHVLDGLTPLEVEFVERASDEIAPAPGTLVKADALHIVLAGQVAVGTRGLVKGESFGEGALLGQAEDSEAKTGEGARLLKLTRAGLESLSDKHPRLGLRLYRNLAMAK